MRSRASFPPLLRLRCVLFAGSAHLASTSYQCLRFTSLGNLKLLLLCNQLMRVISDYDCCCLCIHSAVQSEESGNGLPTRTEELQLRANVSGNQMSPIELCSRCAAFTVELHNNHSRQPSMQTSNPPRRCSVRLTAQQLRISIARFAGSRRDVRLINVNDSSPSSNSIPTNCD
jgi:hypothetical protein